MQKLLNPLRRLALPAILGSALFLSIAHHTVNYWELSAAVLIVSFLMIVPVIAGAIHLLANRVAPHLQRISKTQIGLFLVAALAISLFVTWRNFHVPSSYQTLTLTPDLSQGQTLHLLEVKANGSVIPLEQAALQSHWKVRDGHLYADSDSEPITVSFKSMVNHPVSILLDTTSSAGGRIHISTGYETRLLETNRQDAGVSLVQLKARYRGIPNSIYIPALVLGDVITFGALILFLLVLQEVGQSSTSPATTTAHPAAPPRLDLKLLLLLGVILHLINILAVPLILDADSPVFLQGAVHLLQYGNLEGVPASRGPVTTFLFAPILFVFGRNVWGMKILLHLISLGCIPICYRLGWQISHNRWVAFLSALTFMITPDAYSYSNYVMSDMPNIFIVLLFCTLLWSALETMAPKWIFAALLASSIATLLRSENLLLLPIGALALATTALGRWLQFHDPAQNLKRAFVHIGLAIVVALLPTQWWSMHNQRVNGFYGTSSYFGVVLYDGWIFFGDASKLSFSDPESAALQKIRSAVREYPIEITDKSGVATAPETISALIKSGYTNGQAMELFKTAALDAIQKDPKKSFELLLLKYDTGLQPELAYNITYSLAGEPVRAGAIKSEFFDPENLSIAPLIKIQRKANEAALLWYPRLYPYWIVVCLLGLLLSLFRRPALPWIALIAIVASRIFIPLTLSVPFWRYTLSGWFPLQIIALSWVWITLTGAVWLFRSRSDI